MGGLGTRPNTTSHIFEISFQEKDQLFFKWKLGGGRVVKSAKKSTDLEGCMDMDLPESCRMH